MPDSLIRNYQPISNAYWLRQNTNNGIPIDCQNAYNSIIKQLYKYYKELVDDIFIKYGRQITLPIGTDILEDYFDGFKFNYYQFSPPFLDQRDGFYIINGNNNVDIYINAFDMVKRKRFTKTHEMFHFAQAIDYKMRKYINDLVYNTTLPPIVIYKLIERAADKATIMYLAPADKFIAKTKETKSILALSEYFQISESAVYYRLRECNILIN